MEKTSSPSMRDIGAVGGPIIFDDLQVDSYRLRAPDTNPADYNNITIDGFTFKCLAYDEGEGMFLHVQTSHKAKLGVPPNMHIHFLVHDDDGEGETIQFQITGIGAPLGSRFESVGTIKSDVYTIPADAHDRHYLLELGDLPAVNTKVSTVYVLKLERITPESGTKYTGRVWVLFTDGHEGQDTTGSRTMYEK